MREPTHKESEYQGVAPSKKPLSIYRNAKNNILNPLNVFPNNSTLCAKIESLSNKNMLTASPPKTPH